MLQLEDTVDRLLPDEQVYNVRSKPETETKSSEKPDRASYEQVATRLSSDENLLYEDTRYDMQTQRYHTRKAEVDAKAGATRHLPRNSNSAAEEAGNTANAKVSQTQHSSTKRSSQRVKNKRHNNGDCTIKQRQHNDRPKESRTPEPDKTCIWVKYRQHRLSALLDTGSNVSIAGEGLAQELGWTIHAHTTEVVGVANKKTMTILGAAHGTGCRRPQCRVGDPDRSRFRRTNSGY